MTMYMYTRICTRERDLEIKQINPYFDPPPPHIITQQSNLFVY